MVRCINIDWLECYCCEPSGETEHTPDYFREKGWVVMERAYGTRVYDSMFTLLEPGSGLPYIEIRRQPVAAKSEIGRTVIPEGSCHIRLANRTCYYSNAAKIMQDFIDTYHYSFVRIARIDLALDFEYFDSRDDPQKFIYRYLSGRYSKINQGSVRAFGKDMWDGRCWNSLAWGSPKSQISTKLYNKTLELSEAKDKPYIRQVWAINKLVDDFTSLTKTREDGTQYKPVIWRLEFSIRSSVHKWFLMETSGMSKSKFVSVHNTLDNYNSKQDQLNVFASLTEHYFHFKYFEEGQRKDRCKDKILFDFHTEASMFFKAEKLATNKPADKQLDALLKRLMKFKEWQIQKETINACDIIIEDIRNKQIIFSAAQPWDSSELTLLRMLVSRRVKQASERPLSQDLAEIRAMLSLEGELFGETDNEQ